MATRPNKTQAMAKVQAGGYRTQMIRDTYIAREPSTAMVLHLEEHPDLPPRDQMLILAVDCCFHAGSGEKAFQSETEVSDTMPFSLLKELCDTAWDLAGIDRAESEAPEAEAVEHETPIEAAMSAAERAETARTPEGN